MAMTRRDPAGSPPNHSEAPILRWCRQTRDDLAERSHRQLSAELNLTPLAFPVMPAGDVPAPVIEETDSTAGSWTPSRLWRSPILRHLERKPFFARRARRLQRRDFLCTP